MSQRKVKNPIHPGEMLQKELLEPMETNLETIAFELGWQNEELEKLISGEVGITIKSALVLAERFKTSSKIWLNLQESWDINNKPTRDS